MEINDVLEHYGVPGMKWGQRRAQKKLEKTASKDAKRHVDAKMAYGKGAGTRRKLLKAELDERMKDPNYKKNFDNALEMVDRAHSAKRAKKWRAKEDVKDQTIRSTKQIAKALTGTTTLAAAGILYMQNKSTVDRFVADALRNI